jgi:hypothetical protein
MTDINQLAAKIKGNMDSLTFYKPKMASFGMTLSITKGTLQLFWTPPFPDASTGFAKEGEKRYDYDNQMVSSISAYDCFKIMGAWNKLLDGTFEDPNAKDEKYKKRLALMRSDGKLLVLDCVDDKSKTATQPKTLRFSILHQGKAQNYIFRTENGELELFKQMVRHTFTNLPYHKMLYDGVLKSIRQSFMDDGEAKTNNGGPKSQGQSTPTTVKSDDDFLNDVDADFSSSVASTSTTQKTTKRQPASEEDPFEDVLAEPPKKTEKATQKKADVQTITDPEDMDFGFLQGEE